LKKEIFINLNTVDLNGHTLEAYRMVRKEAWGSAAVLGQGPGRGVRAAAGKGSETAEGEGLCTEDRARGRRRAMYNRNRKGGFHFNSFGS
jgi:hypothetical protein